MREKRVIFDYGEEEKFPVGLESSESLRSEDLGLFGDFDGYATREPSYEEDPASIITPYHLPYPQAEQAKISPEEQARRYEMTKAQDALLKNISDPNNKERKERLTTGKTPAHAPGYHAMIDADLQNHIVQKTDTPERGKFSIRNHFSSVIAEDGVSFLQLKNTWIQQNGGVLQADHTKKEINNSSILEWMNQQGNFTRAKNSFTTRKEYIPNRQAEISAQQKFRLKYAQKQKEELKSITGEINPNNIIGLTAFINGDAPEDIKTTEALAEVQQAQKNTAWFGAIPNILSSYEEYLQYSQESSQLTKELELINALILEQQDPNWATIIEKNTQDITAKEETIAQMKRDGNTDSKEFFLKQEELKQMKAELSFYTKYSKEHGEMHSNEKAYEAFFNTPKEKTSGTGEMTGFRSPANAVGKLKEFYDWIPQQLFVNGVAKPINHTVQAILIAACYRGELSPTSLSGVLVRINNAGEIQSFYDALANASHPSLELSKRGQVFSAGMSPFQKYFEEGEYQKLQNLSTQWGKTERIADTNFRENEGPLKNEFLTPDTAFEQKYGFRIRNAYAVWKTHRHKSIDANQTGKNIDTGLVDMQDNTMRVDTTIPLVDFISENGQVNSSDAMKQMLHDIITTVDMSKYPEKQGLYTSLLNGDFDPADPQVINFVTMLRDNFMTNENVEQKVGFDNTSLGSANFLKSVQGLAGETGVEYLQYMGEEMMDGNLMYWAFAGGMLWLSNKHKWLGKGVMWGATAMLGNAVVEDMTGFDALGEGLFLLAGNTEAQAGNAASWAVKEMSKADTLKTGNEAATERAATILGKCNLAETLDWYTACKQKRDMDNPDDLNVFSNEKMPAPLKENLGLILRASGFKSGTENSNAKAKIAFEFFEQYLVHVDQKVNHRVGSASAENGYKYLSDNFVNVPQGHVNYDNCQKTYTEGTNGIQKGYRLEQVYAQLISSTTISSMVEEGIPLLNIFGEWADDAQLFAEAHLHEAFGGKENAFKYLGEVAADAKAWGWKIYDMTADEIMFRDRTGELWTITKEKTAEAANGLWKVVRGDKVMEWTGDTFNDGWNFIKETAQNAKDGVAYLNNFFAGANMDMLSKESPTAAGGIDIMKAAQSSGLVSSITATYGITSENETLRFLARANNNADIQKDIQAIANARKKLDANGDIPKEDEKILNKDVAMYFFGWAGFGVGAAAQMGIDVVETVSSIANQAVQGVVGVVNDDAKAFLMEYEPTKLVRIFPRDNIDGKESFRNFVRDESTASLNGNASTEILTTETTMRTYIHNKTNSLLENNPLTQENWFLEIFQKPWNVIITEINSVTASAAGGNLTIPLWENLSDTDRKHVIPFVQNEMKHFVADRNSRTELIKTAQDVSPGTVITKQDLDTAITMKAKEFLKEYSWTI